MLQQFQALARKYRPKKLSEVAGHQYILQALTYSIIYNKTHHAYLFTGPHGVGKTSLIRIFAQALNCSYVKNGDPCGVCKVCQDIQTSQYVDVLEVDGATYNKIEDIQNLLEDIYCLPSRGSFKIYIIDEAHMLSTYSFNALLKIMEEPPQHIKFFFSTTNLKKIPATIISRCIHFQLKLLPLEVIEQKIREILKEQHIQNYEEKALHIISRVAKGSMRDALSLLDQILVAGEGILSYKIALEILGISDLKFVELIFQAIIQQNRILLHSHIQAIARQNIDPQKFIDELAFYTFAAYLYQTTNELLSYYCIPDIVKMIAVLEPLKLKVIYESLLKAKEEIILAPCIEAGLTMTLLPLCIHE